MDIGQMARPLLGDSRLQPQETKALELRSGQVVRGVVLQVLDDQEALVSINGTPVKARLETPLQPGQSSWMQVQPESSADASLVLKMVKTGPQSSDEAITRQLTELGLKDTPLNRELLRQASGMGIELRARDARALATFLARHDAPIDSARWIQSALITVQRGLPLTMDAVQSVAQAVYGKPLPQQLSSVLTQLQQLADNAQLDEPTRQWIGKLIQGINRWLSAASGRDAASVRQGTSAAGGSPAGQAQPVAAQADPSGVASVGTRAPAAGSSAAPQATATPTQGEPAAAAGRQPRAGSAPHAAGGSVTGQHTAARSGESAPAAAGQQTDPPQPGADVQASAARPPQATAMSSQLNGALLRNLLHRLGLGHEHSLLKTLVLQQPEGNAYSGSGALQSPQGTVQHGSQTSPSGGQQVAVPPASPQQVQQPVAQSAQMPGNQPITLGAQTAQQPAAQLTQLPGGQLVHPSPASTIQQQGAQPILQPGAQATQQPGAQFPMPSAVLIPVQLSQPSEAAMPQQAIPETIKSLLLQAANSEQLPQALRETIQQAVQSITGQQLLLSADRSAPVTYITMFIPFTNEQGEQLASVHIQTRKGRRGGLDSDNCHLLFDLRMSALGEMMIDVQVTDRIVSLHIYNDHPLMKRLAEEGKQGIQQALAEMGYRLSAMKVAFMPDPATTAPPAANEAASVHTSVSDVKKYTAGSTYKGVDLRI